jgi:hypothetical protein
MIIPVANETKFFHARRRNRLQFSINKKYSLVLIVNIKLKKAHAHRASERAAHIKDWKMK